MKKSGDSRDGGVVFFPNHLAIDPKEQAPPGAGSLGMWLFLLSLAMLFAASIASYILIRAKSGGVGGSKPLELPSGLWVGTALLIGTSVAVHVGLMAIRKDRHTRLSRSLYVATILGAAFTAAQLLNWTELVRQQGLRLEELGEIAGVQFAQFLFLTGLHLAHVIGGLILLLVVSFRARAGRYSANWHPGPRYVAMYWHFLDIVWIVLFAALLLTH